jgi:hypothetical protein
MIGIPWQDIAVTVNESGGDDGVVRYISVTNTTSWGDVTTGGRWKDIYGDDDANLIPDDPHMIESVEPRPGIPGPAAPLMQDSMVGHEYFTARNDLEYACIFPLVGASGGLITPRACACPNPADAACRYQHPNDCCILSYDADAAGYATPGTQMNKPLCQQANGSYGSTQNYAKAYPGLREIQVLHDYATGPVKYTDRGGTGNSIVASICPKDLTVADHTNPGYGYNPATRAIIDRIKERL